MTVPSIVLRVPEIIGNVLDGAHDPAPGASLRDDLGADSIDLLELVMAIEEDFEIEIDDLGVIDAWKTVGDVVAYVEKATAGRAR